MIKWYVETSHMVAVPRTIMAEDLADLYRKLQAIADSKKRKPLIGELSFKLHPHGDNLYKVNSYFRGQKGNTKRFMRVANFLPENANPEERSLRYAES